MLVPLPVGMNPYELEKDDFGMYEKAQHSAYMQEFDPMTPEYKLYPQKPYAGTQHMKKSRQPLDQHEFYVALVFNPSNGKISIKSSSLLKQFRDDIAREAIPKLQAYVSSVLKSVHPNNETHSFGNPQDALLNQDQLNARQDLPYRVNKRKNRVDELGRLDNSFVADDMFSNQEEDLSAERSGRVTYRANDRVEWEKWFYHAFRAVQQVSCRVIAKEWIKTIHPKKQSTHPYNGKNPKTGVKGDPDSTKPPYWPHNVIHKEPDHINKEARTKLLVHLLMSTPHQEMSTSGDARVDREITAATLKESLDQKKLEASNKDLRKRFSIVEEIIDIRAWLEQHECGGLPCSATMTASDYSEFSRGSKADDESDEVEQDDVTNPPEPEDHDEDAMEITTDLKDEEAAIAVNENSLRPQRDQLNDRERKAHRNSRKGSSMTDVQPVAAPTSRKLLKSHFPSTRYHCDQELHPPLIYPGWNTYHDCNPLLMKHSAVTHVGESHAPPPEAFDNMHWGRQIHSRVGLSSQFDDHCMLSPHPQDAFSQPGYRAVHPQSFNGVPHSQLGGAGDFQVNVPDARHSHLRGQYDAFATNPSLEHEAMGRACFPQI